MLQLHQLESVSTEDGSTTLRHRDLDVLYRSSEGALGESHHVFLNGTQLGHHASPWHVMELGLGTGLNFAVTAREALRRQVSLVYHAVDHAPIPEQHAAQLSLPHNWLTNVLVKARQTGQTAWDSALGITLFLHPHPWHTLNPLKMKVHAFYHDPFDPQTNPDCWKTDTFRWAMSHLREDALLSTYSAAGHIRRAMRDAGFWVARAPGFGKKREMTVAGRNATRLHPFEIKYKP